MEELLASNQQKFNSVSRGDEVEGRIVAITDSEIIIDINTKSEGVINKREFVDADLQKLKIGDKVTAFSEGDNDSGQVSLSLQRAVRPQTGHFRNLNWDRFNQALSQRSKLTGTVTEVNKGGLIVEVDGVRGFLPSSQLGYPTIALTKNGAEITGQQLTVEIIEIDQNNNRLIFSQKNLTDKEVVTRLQKLQTGQKVTAKVMAVFPFGLFVDVDGVFGVIYTTELSWEKDFDITKSFKVESEIAVLVSSVDDSLGRINLSVKSLKEDPFDKVLEKYPADEVVKVTVSSVSDLGITFTLEEGVEGFMAADRVEGQKYEPGQAVTMIVGEVDKSKRKVNLSPMITSTKGLIYK